MVTIPENVSLLALARRLGFVHERIQRSHNLERGRRVDVLWLGLLREEWAQSDVFTHGETPGS
jgi:RimJ/RimL family protein N-acetyltransferase